MYNPGFNSVLVEIDDAEAKWGNGNDDSMLGKSYRFGKVVKVGGIMATKDYPVSDEDLGNTRQFFVDLIGKSIMWNDGVEAGTVFEHDGKQYGFIYWWDVRGVRE